MTTRASVAALYKQVNDAYRPYCDEELRWLDLTKDMVVKWFEQLEVAAAVDRSWRREMARQGKPFVGCLFGDKGCPPWGVRNCEGAHGATERAGVREKGISGAKQGGLL